MSKIVVAKIVGVYGIKGWVKLFSYTEPRENILQYKQLYVENKAKPDQYSKIVLLDGKLHKGKTIIAHFKGYDEREQVRDLQGLTLYIDKQQLENLRKDDYYWVDLIGLMVVNAADITLGSVSNLIETGANDVLVIKAEQEILIPYLWGDVVKQVDLEKKCIYVDWDEDYS